jgi:L-fucose isomerase-like protein
LTGLRANRIESCKHLEEDMSVKVKLGYVPSYRFRFSPWCAKMRDESLAVLRSIEGVEVVVPEAAPEGTEPNPARGTTRTGAVSGLDEGEGVAEYFLSQKVDGLILCPLDFGDERSASKIAEKLQVPVLLYATKEPPAVNDASLARQSDSYCGNLSMASGLYRRNIAFRYAGIYCPEEPELLYEFETFAAACAVIKHLVGARIGQVGVRPNTFETVAYDEVAMIQKFQQNVIPLNIADIVFAAKSFADDDPKVQALIANVRETVPNITVADDYLLNEAKVELALRNFYTENKLSAMAVQCWPSIGREMGISVCALYGRLTENEMLTACEVDVLGSLAMMVNYYAGMGHIKPHFIDWTIQHRDNPNWLLAWHCGNAPVSLAADPCKVALRSRMNMTGELPVKEHDFSAGLHQFQIKPGVVTFCRLQEYDNEWKMLIATGEIVSSDEELAGTWSWVAVRDHEELYRTLVEEGFVHHASMIHGDQTDVLLEVCDFLDIEPIVVM